jgi:hypothetical protein
MIDRDQREGAEAPEDQGMGKPGQRPLTDHFPLTEDFPQKVAQAAGK